MTARDLLAEHEFCLTVDGDPTCPECLHTGSHRHDCRWATAMTPEFKVCPKCPGAKQTVLSTVRCPCCGDAYPLSPATTDGIAALDFLRGELARFMKAARKSNSDSLRDGIATGLSRALVALEARVEKHGELIRDLRDLEGHWPLDSRETKELALLSARDKRNEARECIDLIRSLLEALVDP